MAMKPLILKNLVEEIFCLIFLKKDIDLYDSWKSSKKSSTFMIMFLFLCLKLLGLDYVKGIILKGFDAKLFCKRFVCSQN